MRSPTLQLISESLFDGAHLAVPPQPDSATGLENRPVGVASRAVSGPRRVAMLILQVHGDLATAQWQSDGGCQEIRGQRRPRDRNLLLLQALQAEDMVPHTNAPMVPRSESATEVHPPTPRPSDQESPNKATLLL